MVFGVHLSWPDILWRARGKFLFKIRSPTTVGLVEENAHALRFSVAQGEAKTGLNQDAAQIGSALAQHIFNFLEKEEEESDADSTAPSRLRNSFMTSDLEF